MRMLLASHGGDFLDTEPKMFTAEKGLKVLVIPTAAYGEDYPKHVPAAEAMLRWRFGHELRELDIRGKSPDEMRGDLLWADRIYVTGGNTFFLLYHSRLTGFDKLLCDAVRGGLPYYGSSAGSLIVGPSIESAKGVDDDRRVSQLTDYTGFGLINLEIIPHCEKPNQFGGTGSIHEVNTIYLSDKEAVSIKGDIYIIEGWNR